MIDDLRGAIAAEELALAATLEALTPDQWDAPTLCAGWSVRHVAAHLCLPFLHSPLAVGAAMLRSRGDFDAVADRFARRDAERSTAELVATIRTNATHRYKPPGGGYEGRAVHTIVHALDIRRPLGLAHTVPADLMVIALDAAVAPKSQAYFGHPFADATVRATDLDWSHGAGPVRLGTADDLVLALCGRTVDLVDAAAGGAAA